MQTERQNNDIKKLNSVIIFQNSFWVIISYG